MPNTPNPNAWSKLIVIAWIAGGCAVDLDEPASRPAPIVNGELDTGDPATVFLWLGGGSCSGTLISPHVILTARHCLEGVSVGSLEVFFGNNADGAGTWIPAVDYEYHSYGDIGMIAMANPGPTTPIPVASQDLSLHIGEPVRIVGFGVTSEYGGGSGVKRQGLTALHHVDGDIMYTGYEGSSTCYGDSGGPNFMTFDGVEHVAGVTSFGTSVCGEPADGAVRTDTYYDWIMAYVDAHDPATCQGDGRCASGCGAPDPDCPCIGDGHCTNACVDWVNDVDCAGCGAGDMCRADCPAPDPDCAPPDDDDDWLGPDAGPGDPADDTTEPGDPPGLIGGCAVAAPRARGGIASMIWITTSLVILALRRRRQSH